MSLYDDMKAAADKQDRIWRALSDPARREILDLLAARPRTTGELAEKLAPLARTTVMKHLDVLAEANLVLIRREGRLRWNHFNPVPIDQVCRRWLDSHRRRTSGRLARLKQVVETPLERKPRRSKNRKATK